MFEIALEQGIAAGSGKMEVNNQSFDNIKVEEWKDGNGFEDTDFIFQP